MASSSIPEKRAGCPGRTENSPRKRPGRTCGSPPTGWRDGKAANNDFYALGLSGLVVEILDSLQRFNPVGIDLAPQA